MRLKFLIVLSILLLAAPIVARAENPGKPLPTLTSTVFAWEKLSVEKRPNGERREVTEGSTPTLAEFRSHVTTLDPGASWGNLDTHADDEVVIVKEGTLDYEIAGRPVKAGPGAVILLFTGEPHRSRNASQTERVTYYVFHLVTAAAKAHNDAVARLAAGQAAPPFTPLRLDPSQSRLASTICKLDQLPVEKRPTGERRALPTGPTPTLAEFRGHVTTLNPGTPWGKLDKHTDDEVSVIKEGTLDYEINDRVFTVGPGSIVFLAAGETHRVRNTSNTPVTFYAFHAVTAEAKAAAEAHAEPGSSSAL